jgi:hypothetical protein
MIESYHTGMQKEIFPKLKYEKNVVKALLFSKYAWFNMSEIVSKATTFSV